jgi:hypothetical protein
MLKVFSVAATMLLVGSSAYAQGQITPKPGEKFLPQVGLDKIKEINNPPKSDSQAGRVIEDRTPPKREPAPKDND